MKLRTLLWSLSSLLLTMVTPIPSICLGQALLTYTPKSVTEKTPRVVFVTGDEEYRSEEGMPQLARILTFHHGFHCTVLFAMDDANTIIDPDNRHNIPGLERLTDAHLMVIFTRFRDLPDDQMKHIVSYVESGRPIVALRTATHAFNIADGKTYSHYSFNSKQWPQGFGRQILGETWINHHGQHGAESTRGIPPAGAAEHPILRGVNDVWGPTDVYGVRLPLPEGCQPILLGQVLDSMKATGKPVAGSKNDPTMPVAWTRLLPRTGQAASRVFVTTMGASQDLLSEGLRRLLVNGCYWALGREGEIPETSKVDLVGEYHPTRFGFGAYTRGIRPQQLAWPPKSAETRPKSQPKE